MRGLLVGFAFLFLVSPAGAQSSPPAPFAQSERAVSTKNLEARNAFDDGFTLLYAFNPEEAERSFERAARADPALAIAWWGIALSRGVNINIGFDSARARRGLEAIEKAQSLEAGASPVERALIDAAAKRYAPTGAGDAERSARAYRDAMNAVAAAYPEDDDVQTLAAEAALDVAPWSYWTREGKPRPGTAATVERLGRVLARDPGHIGANHFLIHVLEASPQPAEALPAARRLAALRFEPAAEHLTHMPAHIFMRVGEYHAAGVANERAVADYRAYLAGDHAGHEDYFEHDCLFGVDAFGMSGEYARAHALAAACRRDNDTLAAIVDLRFRRWTELASLTAPGDFAIGMLDVVREQLASAADRLRALRRVRDATVEADVLEGRIDEARGATDAAIAVLERAVAETDAAGYSEPPAFWYPLRETLGGTYLRAARYRDAERTFRADLALDPLNPRSLFGLEATLEREGRAQEAATVETDFKLAWRDADVPLDVKEL